MKIQIIVTAIFFMVFLDVFSQSWHVGVGSGFMTHSQSPLKNFNKSIKEIIPFETEITDNFPTTSYFQGEIEFRYDQLIVGLIYTYNSTGSRVTSTDYSGSYYYDITLNGNIWGIYIGTFTKLNDRLKLHYNIETGEIFSSLKLKESISINNVGSNEDIENLYATGLYFKPNLKLSYEYAKFNFNLNCGYIIDTQSPFHLKDQEDATLLNPTTNEKIKTEWNGLMVGISVSYSLLSYNQDK